MSEASGDGEGRAPLGGGGASLDGDTAAVAGAVVRAGSDGAGEAHAATPSPRAKANETSRRLRVAAIPRS